MKQNNKWRLRYNPIWLGKYETYFENRQNTGSRFWSTQVSEPEGADQSEVAPFANTEVCIILSEPANINQALDRATFDILQIYRIRTY